MPKLTSNQKEILQRARRMIEAREENYICRCLWKLEFNLIDGVEDCRLLEKWIMRMLEHHLFLEDWMHTQTGRQPTREEARQTRLKWIDWMLEQ